MLRTVIGLGFICFCCAAKKSLTGDQLQSFVLNPANGLVQKVEKGNVTLEAVYRPKDLVLAREIEGMDYSEIAIDSIRENLSSLDYFVINLSRAGTDITTGYAGDEAAFGKAVNYLSFGMGSDLRLANRTDTISVEDFVYAHSFGSARAASVLVVFKTGMAFRKENFSLLYNDSFFGTGFSVFSFDIDQINSIPSLELKSI